MLVTNYLVELSVVFATAFILLYLYFTRNFSYWKNKNVPFLKPLPFFGNIIDGIMMRQCMGEIFYNIYTKAKEPFMGFFVLDKPCLLLRDLELIKRVLVTDFQHFYDRSGTDNERDDPIGTHILFMLKNPSWKEIRTKITPVFTSSKIKNMSKLIEQSANEMVNYLERQMKKNSVIETKEVCSKFTVDVISSTAFGVDANCFKDEKSQFRVAAKTLLDWDNLLQSFQMRCYLLAPKLVSLFRMTFLNPSSVKFLKKSFLEIMEHRDVSKSIRNDLVDILLKIKSSDSKFIEGDKLVSQAIMFFAAGFETTSSAMSFSLYEIVQNPEIQNRLRKEIEEVSSKHGGIHYESLKEMTYLDMCFKETLRKYPVLPFLDRMCNDDYKFPGTDLILEKGTSVFISLLGLHYDPQYYPNPEKYDPERFSKANYQPGKLPFLSFGEGPRGCIGDRFGMLNAKIGLANIIKHFKLSDAEETQKKIKFQASGFVLSPVNGIKLKYEKI